MTTLIYFIVMKQAPQEIIKHQDMWEEYRDNFPRHLLGVNRYLQTEMMSTLQQHCGHKNLRLSFAPYITLIGVRGKRPSVLAEVLGISRQACNQAVNQIEAAGYLSRTEDPADGRATLLVLTEQGQKLRNDGIAAVSVLDTQFLSLTDQVAVTGARKTLEKIYDHLNLGLTKEDNMTFAAESLGALLPRLGDYIVQRLMELTIEKGHPDLQLSFGQVLTLIGKSGGKIQHIAKIQDVSKQAISATATELASLGYLRRETDQADARQVLLRFTSLGEDLIRDSIRSVYELEAEFSAITSKAAVARLKTTFDNLYHALHLEQSVFEYDGKGSIEKLAQQIQQQLGTRESRVLAQLLLNSDYRTA
jgi:DNA-binding MarR family transcriptional regulator